MSNIYKNTKLYTIAKDCPWHEAQQSYGPPNINWCEVSSCSIIDEPANTWSNFSFFICAYIIWVKMKDVELRYFSLVIFVTGLFSFIYHATNNYFSQFLDFIGMFLMVSYILTFSVTRLLNQQKFSLSLFWFFNFFYLLLFMIFDFHQIPIQIIIVLAATLIVSTELYVGHRQKLLKHYKYFWLAGVTIALAQTCAMVDLKKIYCNPENLILHGHVFWHLLNGLGMFFLAMHMKKVKSLN